MSNEALLALRDRKQVLESEIRDVVSKLLKEFEDETGVNPAGVSIYMTGITKISERDPRWVVSGCNVDIKV